MKKCYLLLVLLSLGHDLKAHVWKINRDHSEIFFQVEYLNVSDVTGRFKTFSGTVIFDNALLPEEISIKIDSSSIDTGNSLRDGHLKSHEFLKSRQHRFITFESHSVSLKSPSTLVASGTLTVAGISKKHSFEFTLSNAQKDTWNYESKFVKFKSKINRKDFKLIWNKTLAENKFLVGDDISIWGTFQLQPTSTPSSKHMIPDTSYMRRREKLNRGELSQKDFAPVKSVVESVSPIVIESRQPLTSSISEIRYDRTFRQNFLWQVSFWTLGLFGFLASIIIGLFTKKVLVEKYPVKYREGGMLGIVSDSIIIVFVLVYVVAFWEVGWG